MFYNLSNVPSDIWSQAKMNEAKRLGGNVLDGVLWHTDPMRGLNHIHNEAFCELASLRPSIKAGAVCLLGGELTRVSVLLFNLTRLGCLCVCETITEEGKFGTFREMFSQRMGLPGQDLLKSFFDGYIGPSRHEAASMFLVSIGLDEACPSCLQSRDRVTEFGEVEPWNSRGKCPNCGAT